jgi:tight adherence protein C
MASERLGGPLGEELRLTIQEQQLGLSTLDSLQNWLARCDTPAVGSFVRSMVQGERLGISIGQILRNLALEMRKRRRQAAEERAHKSAIKILFPLVFLIFPAMFVVILAPALYRIIDTLSGH